MTRKQSAYARKRRHAPPAIAPNAHETALRGVLLLSPSDREAFLKPAREAAERLIASTGNLDDWKAITKAHGYYCGFARLPLVRNAKGFVDASHALLVAAITRQQETGSNCLRPVEVEALRELIDAYREVLDVATCWEMHQAVTYYEQCGAELARGGKRPGAVLLEVRA
jgi:hypothetical protein